MVIGVYCNLSECDNSTKDDADDSRICGVRIVYFVFIEYYPVLKY